MCESMMVEEHFCEKYFLDDMVKLSSDRTVNVRITLAQICAKHCHSDGPMKYNIKI